ncbi:hypothetical protein QTP88_012513 [Uroleucon formosanum]
MKISEIPRKKNELELCHHKIQFTIEDGRKLSYFFFLRDVFFFLNGKILLSPFTFLNAIIPANSNICSFYSYGQISSDKDFDLEDNFDDSDKDPDYLPEFNTAGDQSIHLAEILSIVDQEEEKDLYSEHIQNKTIVREKKNFDKVRSEKDKEFYVAVFDTEKVLITPQGDVSSFYYKRKFATYNFTIFDIGKKHGYCFVWHQSEGNRGSNEISICLYQFLKIIKDQGIKKVVFYSDNW